MDPDRIIKYVHKCYRDFWRKECELTCHAFGALLQPHLSELTASDYTRLTSKTTTPKKIMEVLKKPEVLKKIENSLKRPSLFLCTNEGEIDRLVDRKAYGQLPGSPGAPSSGCVLVPDVLNDEQISLCAREKRVVEHLVKQVINAHENIVCWTDPPPVGAAFVAYTAAGTYLHCKGVESTILIQPFPSSSSDYLSGKGHTAPAFDRALLELGQRFGLSGRPTAAELLAALKRTKTVVFVLQANYIESSTFGRKSEIEEILHLAQKSARPEPGEPAPIVLVGRPQISVSSTRVQLVENLREDLAFRTKTNQRNVRERNEFFEEQWRRYAALRDQPAIFQAGSSRLKRARQYYTADAGSVVWPSTLRMLAFFASNVATFSYFDPTAGWDPLAGMDLSKLPIDVKLHLSEVVLQARSIREPNKRKTGVRAARWCSTAVYWLTENAAENLGKLKPRTTLDGFRAAVERLQDLVEIVPRSKQGVVYKMDMALRAVIQQRWQLADPCGRAEAHHQIANRLFESRDDKDLLHAEYPVEPHWGRSRMHFLAEAFRHLIRACDTSFQATAQTRFQPEFAEKFPDPPKLKHGCDPVQVINFCFSRIFWVELNGNTKGDGIHRRSLARRHGAYHLTAELLQMLSHNNRLGKPHPALNPAYVPKYLREVGYAQLDLGDLSNAKANFQHLLEHAQKTKPDDLTAVIQAQLDLTIVLCAMGDLGAARTNLSVARNLAAQLPKIEGDRKTSLPTKNEKNRLDAREANLFYLEGDLEAALSACERIEKSSGAVVRDVAHVYIAALGARNKGTDLQRAMGICVRNLFENASDGLSHEALGFRVALGHTFRKQGLLDVAEVTLDLAYKDILKYGCSERTYLATLLEAGRIVYVQGRAARAYAAYLRPCLDRAKSRGYARTAETARSYARDCIVQLLNEFAEPTPATTEKLRKEVRGRGEYLRPVGSAMLDPQFSYEAPSINQWISRLQTQSGLEAELRKLS